MSATLAVAFVGYGLVRRARLMRVGAELVRRSGRLPRQFTVGQGRPFRMVVLGDSTAVGVGASWVAETIPCRVAVRLPGKVAVQNLAVSGARLADVVAEQLPQVPPNADFVLVSATANDATGGTSPKEVQNDLGILFEGLRERGVRHVAMSTTPNFRTTPALPWILNRVFGGQADDLAAAIRKVAAQYPFVRLAELNERGTLSRSQYADDGFHPNAAGYETWAELFVQAAPPLFSQEKGGVRRPTSVRP